MNGGLAGWHSHAQISKAEKDIAEPGMEPNTHAFANDNVDVVNWDKSKEPFVANGS
jgi:hypothetical protein